MHVNLWWFSLIVFGLHVICLIICALLGDLIEGLIFWQFNISSLWHLKNQLYAHLVSFEHACNYNYVYCGLNSSATWWYSLLMLSWIISLNISSLVYFFKFYHFCTASDLFIIITDYYFAILRMLCYIYVPCMISHCY